MLSIVKPVKTLVLGSIQLRLKNINKTNKYAEHLYNCDVELKRRYFTAVLKCLQS